MTNQVALFTGFLATPGTGTGMDILNAELSTIGIPDYDGRVFAWTQQQEAFDWIAPPRHEDKRRRAEGGSGLRVTGFLLAPLAASLLSLCDADNRVVWATRS